MKQSIPSKRILTALVMGAFASPATATVTAVRGDLVAAFYEVENNAATANTYVVRLGSAHTLREGTMTTNLNVNLDLTAAFGADWATSGTVRWSILGVIGGVDPVNNGDPSFTTYLSRNNNGVIGTSSAITLSATQRGTLTTQLSSYFSPLTNGIAEGAATQGGAIYPSSNPNSAASFLPPATTTFFGIGVAPYATMNGVAAGVDVYRTLDTLTGADRTVAATPGNANVGQGKIVGSFRLDTLGNLTTIPEPSSMILLGLISMMGLGCRSRSSN